MRVQIKKDLQCFTLSGRNTVHSTYEASAYEFIDIISDRKKTVRDVGRMWKKPRKMMRIKCKFKRSPLGLKGPKNCLVLKSEVRSFLRRSRK